MAVVVGLSAACVGLDASNHPLEDVTAEQDMADVSQRALEPETMTVHVWMWEWLWWTEQVTSWPRERAHTGG